MILAVDPGNEQSAYCLIDDERRPIEHGKVDNAQMLEYIYQYFDNHTELEAAAVEMVASYGMAVGKSVFDTCVMIGRITEALSSVGVPVEYVYRIEEKTMICHDSRAKDGNIRQALIDRYAQHDFKNGRGTKKNPDWFYGFASDQWAAYAVGIVWLDKREKGEIGE